MAHLIDKLKLSDNARGLLIGKLSAIHDFVLRRRAMAEAEAYKGK